MGTTLIATIGSAIAGGTIAAIGIVGLVNAQTAAPAQNPTNANQPVQIQYGDN